MRRTPITDKKTTRITYGNVTSVVCHMQGWRKSMEDNSSMVQLPSGILMYIVCDGHGGEEVANFACKYLPVVFNNLEQNFTDDEIKNGFIELDNMIMTKKLDEDGSFEILNCANKKKKVRDSMFKSRLLEYKRDCPELTIDDITKEVVCDSTGSTATVVFIDNNRIVTATLGDCQAVISRKNDVSFDLQEIIHHLSNKDESERVHNAGLTVFGTPLRIGGDLAVSRSFGDLRFKKQGTPKLPDCQQPVSIIPDIMVMPRTSDDEFILIGSDGVFDVLTSEQAVKKVKESINTGVSIEKALEQVLDDCCALDSTQQLGKDNMSIMFIHLNSVEHMNSVDEPNNKRLLINSRLAMTPEQLSEYEKYKFNECHGGC